MLFRKYFKLILTAGFFSVRFFTLLPEKTRSVKNGISVFLKAQYTAIITKLNVKGAYYLWQRRRKAEV